MRHDHRERHGPRSLTCYLYRTTIGSITALLWMLLNNPAFRAACGFTDRIPAIRTLSRVFSRMVKYSDAVEQVMDEIVGEVRKFLPGQCEEPVVEATPVRSYSDGNRKPPSDPVGEWGINHRAKTKEGLGRWTEGVIRFENGGEDGRMVRLTHSAWSHRSCRLTCASVQKCAARPCLEPTP